MKRLILTFALFSVGAFAQQTCNILPQTVTGTGRFAVFNNTGLQCSTWRFSYFAQGFSALNIQMEAAPDNNGVPGAWSVITTTATCVFTGNNPSTVTSSAVTLLQNCYFPWVSFNLTSKTGTGSLTLTANGSTGLAASIPAASGGTSGPVATGWTVVNGAQLSNLPGTGSINVFAPGAAGLNWRLVTMPVPGATYTVISTNSCYYAGSGSGAQNCGLYLTDGTKLEGIEMTMNSGNNLLNIRVEKMTNVTTDLATLAGPTASVLGTYTTFKIVEDGVHRTFYYYLNGAYVQFFQEPTGTFLTPNAVGFGGLSLNSTGSGPLSNTLLSWTMTTP